MPYTNYKEAPGARARGDLSANVRPTRMGALDDTYLVKVAAWLAKHAREQRDATVKAEMCGTLSDVILECVNRVGEP